jgi:glycosyltransferase involved in cell wall biosynthesis
LPEELRHGVTGVLVPPEDAGALADALDHLLADPVARQRYGEAAARAATTMPTWTDVAARILAVYEDVAHST